MARSQTPTDDSTDTDHPPERVKQARREAHECPECGRALGDRRPQEVQAELRRSKDTICIVVEFTCGGCGGELFAEELIPEEVCEAPDRLTYHFDGDGYEV